MSEPARPGVATHSLRYVSGNVLVMIAGFVSFPIMTRLLDNGQYGILGYFDAWLLIHAQRPLFPPARGSGRSQRGASGASILAAATGDDCRP